MIIPINRVADWKYIRQRKQTQINKDVTREKILEYIAIIDWEKNLWPEISQRINMKPCSKDCMELFKCGQTVPSPYKQ